MIYLSPDKEIRILVTPLQIECLDVAKALGLLEETETAVFSPPLHYQRFAK